MIRDNSLQPQPALRGQAFRWFWGGGGGGGNYICNNPIASKMEVFKKIMDLFFKKKTNIIWNISLFDKVISYFWHSRRQLGSRVQGWLGPWGEHRPQARWYWWGGLRHRLQARWYWWGGLRHMYVSQIFNQQCWFWGGVFVLFFIEWSSV